jgi:NADH-quinone oxidoreductase subunit K
MRMSVPTEYYVILSSVLFSIGAVGVLIKKNPIVLLMCIEVMMNSANLLLIAYARQLRDMTGQVFVFFVLVVAAAEVAVGLSIIVAIFRTRRTIDADELSLMKW